MTYTDKLSGEQVNLTRRTDKLVVKFSTIATTDAEERALDTQAGVSVLHGVDRNQNIGLYEINSDALDTSTISQIPDVEGAINVYEDQLGNEHYFLPDELTVQFQENISEEQQLALIAAQGATVLKKQFTPGYYTLAIPKDQDIFQTIENFNGLDEVMFSEPSTVGFDDELYLPNDAEFGQQWALRNTGQTGGQAGADVKATAAWDLHRGNPDIAIAIIDTGVALNHADLQSNLLTRPAGEDWDFADNSTGPSGLSPDDGGSHGTHCAGIAAATDNAIGIVGMAPGCSILPIRIDLSAGRNANRADAINFVTSIRHRFKQVVINCSWRASGNITAIRAAIINATNQGVLICFAAGNDNRDMDVNPQYPGAYSQVISVAATDHRDRKASFTNYGSTVDVSAPGVSILSTIPGNRYDHFNGTSMASPLVAGLAGLIWSKNPALSSAQVRQIIENNCDNIDALNPGFAGKLGKGRVNALLCLQNTPSIFIEDLGSMNADLTGDGKADIVGFGNHGVYVSLNNGNGTFKPIQRVVNNFAYNAGGWRVDKHPRFLTDITGDGRADIVGFGNRGVYVSINHGDGTFKPVQRVINNFGYTAGGWRVEKHPRFLADLTGDNRSDIVGCGNRGVYVALNNGDGTFQPVKRVINNFAYTAGGWRVEKHPRFLADLTGDGRADIVGFGNRGVYVALNNGDGTFQPVKRVINNFGYTAGGWRVEKHPRFLADLTGDGWADIVGFGNRGVYIALSNGDGTFQPVQRVIDNFAYNAGGWRVDKHPRFLADLTGDRRADIVGFGNAGVYAALNNGNGTMQAIRRVINNFGYNAGGWRVERHPRFGVNKY